MVRTVAPSSQRSPLGACWHTASSGGSADTTPHELSALEDHLSRCHATRGRMFHVRRHMDATLDFIAAHLVTSALCVGLVSTGLIWLR